MDARVIKIGGELAGSAGELQELAADLAVERGWVLVHGGGAEVSQLARRFGVEPRFVDGVRQTSAEEMDYVDMALSGQINKRLVRLFQSAGLNAVGLSGSDGRIFTGRPVAPGSRTGDVAAVEPALLLSLLGGGWFPVLCSTSMGDDGLGLNINADSAALAVAAALRARTLVFLSDIPGVLKDGKVIERLTDKGRARRNRERHDHRGHGRQGQGLSRRPRRRRRVDRHRRVLGPGFDRGSAGRKPRHPDRSKVERGKRMNKIEIAEQAFVEQVPFPKNYSSRMLVLVKGKGVHLEDRAGNRYIDFASGIAVNALGHGREDLARAAYDQMMRLAHVSNLYATEPAIELAERLVASGPFQAVHFGNSGTEANEAALKYARLYSLRTKGEGNHRILCFTNAFHGRTLGALACTPTAKYQDPFKPLMPGVEVAPYNDVAKLEAVLDRSFAAVIVEVVQGEGGLDAMSPEFVKALNRLCRKHDVVLIADEVQTGLGRTGTLYASSGAGLEPDIITLAKPLAGGLPLSATLIPARVNEQVHVGEHGTTFGGGPVTTAVALKVWDIVSNPDFLAGVGAQGRASRPAAGGDRVAQGEGGARQGSRAPAGPRAARCGPGGGDRAGAARGPARPALGNEHHPARAAPGHRRGRDRPGGGDPRQGGRPALRAARRRRPRPALTGRAGEGR